MRSNGQTSEVIASFLYEETLTDPQKATVNGVIGQQGLRNYVPGSLRRWQKALAGVRNGTANAVIATCGTSITMGAYAGNSSINGSRPGSLARKLVSMLSGYGIPSVCEMFFGNGSTTSGNPLEYFDSRITRTGSWAIRSNEGISAGGYGVIATTTGTIAFTFDGAFDTLVVYEGQYGTPGAYSANIDGSTVVTASQACPVGPASVSKRVHTFSAVSAGAHTLNLAWVSGAPILHGAELYSSTSKIVRIVNLGIGGSKISDWDVDAPTYNGAIFVINSTVSPDLVLVEMGPNDWGQGTNVAAYTASLTSFLTKIKAVRDVIFFTSWPSQTTVATVAAQQSYVKAAIGVCISLGIPFVDEWSEWGTWSALNTAGTCQDSYHPNASGVTMRAEKQFRTLLTI